MRGTPRSHAPATLAMCEQPPAAVPLLDVRRRGEDAARRGGEGHVPPRGQLGGTPVILLWLFVFQALTRPARRLLRPGLAAPRCMAQGMLTQRAQAVPGYGARPPPRQPCPASRQVSAAAALCRTLRTPACSSVIMQQSLLPKQRWVPRRGASFSCTAPGCAPCSTGHLWVPAVQR